MALGWLLLVIAWQTYEDYEEVRSSTLRMHMAMLRGHVQRTAGRLEHAAYRSETPGLTAIVKEAALHDLWNEVGPFQDGLLYAAVVSPEGRVVAHTQTNLEEGLVERKWYERTLPAAGARVVETSNVSLTGGERVIDVSAPIEVNGQEIGEYHAAIAMSAFDEDVRQRTRQFLGRRAVTGGTLLLAVVAAGLGLVILAGQNAALRRKVDAAYVEQSTEISRMAAGLAHEIRNPLHALQLNLHTFRRSRSDPSLLGEAEVQQMLDESVREVERIEHLMHELVGFAAPTEPGNDTIDLPSEVEAVVQFIRQELIRQDVEIHYEVPATAVMVPMAQGRLRQILLNLLHNSAEAMPSGGKIQITVSVQKGKAQLVVADSGPGVAAVNHERIFEPFFSEKSDGSGLGLALVKRFVEQAGGSIHYQATDGQGASFVISLPIVRHQPT